jgi:hypothetical protein
VQNGITFPSSLAFLPLAIGLGLVVLTAVTLVSIASYSGQEFREVRSSKTLWIMLVITFGWLSPFFYFATVRRRLGRLRHGDAS